MKELRCKLCNQSAIDIEEEYWVPTGECCIYRVPANLRKINEEAYTPRMISIGPFHYGKEELTDMEKQKKICQTEFWEQFGEEKMEEFKTFIKCNEQTIRRNYSESTYKFQYAEFVSMILHDAVFILHLFLKNHHDRDMLLYPRTSLIRDLQLLENQLPFYVLKKLHTIIAFSTAIPNLLELSCKFFGLVNVPQEADVKHFTDLRRYALVNIHPRNGINGKKLPSAIKLYESGVKIKPIAEECSLDIRFKKVKGLIFHSYELQIAKFIIDETTECLIRNLMAFEQRRDFWETRICNYIILMAYLAKTGKDLELLIHLGIVSNYLDDNATVVKMLERLCLQIITINDSYPGFYGDGNGDLDAYYNSRPGGVKPKLLSFDLRNLCRSIGTVATILFLVFILIQFSLLIVQIIV